MTVTTSQIVLIFNDSLLSVVRLLVQLWKRSGAWFYKGLPQYIRPAPKKPSSMRISASSKSGTFRSADGQNPRKTYGGWSRSGGTSRSLLLMYIIALRYSSCSKLTFSEFTLQFRHQVNKYIFILLLLFFIFGYL